MAEPFEGQVFDNYDAFDHFMQDYCEHSAQTFVVGDSRRIEKHPKLSSATHLQYSFLKLMCVKYGSKHMKKSRPVTGSHPNQWLVQSTVGQCVDERMLWLRAVVRVSTGGFRGRRNRRTPP